MTLSFRPIRPEDAAAVAAIIRAVMPEFGADGPGFAIHDPEVDAMAEAYGAPGAAYFVVEDERKRLMGGGGFAPLEGGDPGVCELKKMYFLPQARGTGMGERLLRHLLEAARQAGHRTMYLETLTGMDAAMKLYAKVGFKPLCAPMGATGHTSCDRWYAMDLIEGPPSKPRLELDRVSGAPVSDEELLSDLKEVASRILQSTITMGDYTRLGKYDCSTLTRRFGSWNRALRLAGLLINNRIDISDMDLFQNILVLWQHLGRQPRRSDLAFPPSTISQSPYNRRFRSWTSALQNFVDYANQAEDNKSMTPQSTVVPEQKRNPRDPSLRLRFKVLQRDFFTCRKCGASPAKSSDVELQIDHVVPYSKGGQTTVENLQTLCSLCNLGKSDLLLE